MQLLEPDVYRLGIKPNFLSPSVDAVCKDNQTFRWVKG